MEIIVETSSTVNLALLLDTLDALEAEVSELPAPAPLFGRELKGALAVALGVAE